MHIIKRFFDLYLNSSIHVALSVYALVRMTGYLFGIEAIQVPALFAFFGTIVAYNFVKYDALARTQKLQMRIELKVITALSVGSLSAAGYYFFQLSTTTKISAFVFLILTLLYTLPFFPNQSNARNWAGVKIYIVALCWVGVTLFLPIIHSGIPFTTEVYVVALQRFILIFVLILIFEIIDLKVDDPNLKTVPQQIGVQRTKMIGSGLLVVFLLFEIFGMHPCAKSLVLKGCIAGTTLVFLLFSHEKRNHYYSSFWVESIPVFWWVLLLLFR